PGGRRTVQELRAEAGEHAAGLVADHTPVADGEELGALLDVIDDESPDHPLDVRRVAGVLDVEEDRVAARGPKPFGRRGRNARGAEGLGDSGGQRRRGRGDGGWGWCGRLGTGGGALDGDGRLCRAAPPRSSGSRSFHARIIRDAPPTGYTRRRRARRVS